MDDLVAEAVKFMRHDGLCGIVGGYGYCTCGMDKARDEIERLRASPLTTERREELCPELSDVEAEAALTGEGIYVWGPEGDKFARMFAAAMKVRAALIAGPVSEG